MWDCCRNLHFRLLFTSRIDDGAICGKQTAAFNLIVRTGSHSLFEGGHGGDGNVSIGSDEDVSLHPK